MSAKISPNVPCPCKSGTKYKKCCRPHHQHQSAPTPEALMRSRFSAYALGLIDYIVQTTDPKGERYETNTDIWRQNIQAFSANTAFNDLKILEVGMIEGEVGTVTFSAVLMQDDTDVSFTERSLFTHRDGKWLYTSGERINS